MKHYIQYLKYVLNHKRYVMVECFKEGMYWQGITHDLSKFLPSEFSPYANYFHNTDGSSKVIRDKTGYYQAAETGDPKFTVAWLYHQNRNPHHWQFWVLALDDGGTLPVPMSEKYAKEMVCDWVGAGKAQGYISPPGNRYMETRSWYTKNKDNMVLHEDTRRYVESIIGWRIKP